MTRSATVKAYWDSPAAAVRRNVVTRSCGQCGGSYSGHPCRIGREFCSRSCLALSQQRRVTKTCISCGSEFVGPRSQMKNRKHCSKDCQRRTYSFVCEGCGSEGEAAYAGRRFCGDGCRLRWFASAFVGEASPQWRGGSIENYGASWDGARDLARARDGHRCLDCGAHEDDLPEQLSVAHVVAFRLFGLERHEEANMLDNLRSLCRRCHLIFDHANGARARTDKLLALELAA